MSQSSIIAGALLVGFIVYITIRGELGGPFPTSYLSVLFNSRPCKPAAAATTTGKTNTGSTTGPTLGGILLPVGSVGAGGSTGVGTVWGGGVGGPSTGSWWGYDPGPYDVWGDPEWWGDLAL